MSIETNANATPFNPNLGRRKFVKTLAVLAGLGVTMETLAACGDATNTAPAAATAASTTAAPAATTAAVTTAAPTTVATTTAAATTAAPTTSAPTTSAATASGTTAASSGDAPAGYTQLGAVSGYKADADPVAFAVSKTKGFVFNKGGTYYVYSNVCTHKGCEVPYVAADSKLECPCHGSQYDKTGEVVKGPAAKRLPQFEYKVVGDNLYAKLS